MNYSGQTLLKGQILKISTRSVRLKNTLDVYVKR